MARWLAAARPLCQPAPWLRSIWRHAAHACNTVHLHGGRAPLCYSPPQQLIDIDCIATPGGSACGAPLRPSQHPRPGCCPHWHCAACHVAEHCCVTPRAGCMPRRLAAWLDHACSRSLHDSQTALDHACRPWRGRPWRGRPWRDSYQCSSGGVHSMQTMVTTVWLHWLY